ncbi:hypothetical protein Q31b_29560 [Novipirellula aureliae]|uniref:Uncharacterized protein n=1 Tax=Novipirellula aureliae TaxID=2527966 RepID=A0A5C6E0M1_9BACT|nr:hypothetical protein Q31b_29560 [Novipirellula aureliae]
MIILSQMVGELPASSASRLATASWLDDFAATSWLGSVAGVTARVFVEQFAEKSLDLRAARRASRFAANWFAATGWLDNFTATGWLGSTAGVTSVVTMEQFAQEATTWGTSAIAARIGATSGFVVSDRGFASASWLDRTTIVTTFVTKLVKQAKSTSVNGTASDESNSEQSGNQYTTHRGISMDSRFGKGSLGTANRNRSEAAIAAVRSGVYSDQSCEEIRRCHGKLTTMNR